MTPKRVLCMSPRRILPLGVLAAVLMAVVSSFAVAHAAGGATFQDGANLFTNSGKAEIQKAAQDAGIRVLVLTTTQSFSGKAAFQHYVRSQSSDRGGITIALYPPQRYTYVLVGPDSGLSPSQASQGIQQARGNVDAGHWTAGVVQMLQYYQSVGASSPGGSTNSSGSSGGISIGGIIVIVVILAILAFILWRIFARRRRLYSFRRGYDPNYGQGYGSNYGPYGPGPGYGPNGPYPQGPYYGNRGGFGRGLLGGLLGGVAGSFIGNELFGDRDRGDVNAAGPDAGANGPDDTASSQQYQGDWSGDAGGWDNSGGDAGGWGGDSGGDSGGWGGDSGGGNDSGSWV